MPSTKPIHIYRWDDLTIVLGFINATVPLGKNSDWRLEHDQNYCDNVQYICSFVAFQVVALKMETRFVTTRSHYCLQSYFGASTWWLGYISRNHKYFTVCCKFHAHKFTLTTYVQWSWNFHRFETEFPSQIVTVTVKWQTLLVCRNTSWLKSPLAKRGKTDKLRLLAQNDTD